MSDTGRPGPSGSWEPTARPTWAPRDTPAPAGAPAPDPIAPGPTPPGAAPLRPAGAWSAQPGPTPPAGAAPRGTVPPARAARGASPFPAAGADADPAGARPASDGPPAHAAGDRRPRWLLPAALGAGVLVVGGVVAGVLLTRDGAQTPVATATTVVLPSPTPTVEAVPREATTAFASALPTSVLGYALASSAPDDERVAAGALEAWTETYTDGGDGTLTVRAAQFETPEEAAAFAGSLVATLPPAAPATPAATGAATAGTDDAPALPQSGEVEAGGAAVGTYTVVDAGDGTGVAVWQNGTAVLQLTAPVDDVADAYAAFPL